MAAMFFSALSLAISLFLLFTAWEDGKLLTNARLLWNDMKPAIDTLTERQAGTAAGEGLSWERLRERLERIELLADNQDVRAEDYLDNLREDLDLLREYSKERSAAFIGEMEAGLERARQELDQNRPAAVATLRALSERMRKAEEPGPKAESAAGKAGGG